MRVFLLCITSKELYDFSGFRVNLWVDLDVLVSSYMLVKLLITMTTIKVPTKAAHKSVQHFFIYQPHYILVRSAEGVDQIHLLHVLAW